MVSRCFLEVTYTSCQALVISYGTAALSRNTIFWIGNTVDMVGHDALYFLPIFLETPNQQQNPRPTQFYTRRQELEPRRPEIEQTRDRVLPEIRALSRTLPRVEAHLRIFPRVETHGKTLSEAQKQPLARVKVQGLAGTLLEGQTCSGTLVEVAD